MQGEDKSTDHIGDLTNVNGRVCNSFARYGQFHSENNGFPCYTSIRGDNAQPIPQDLSLEHKVWPVYNPTDKDLVRAVQATERLGGILMQPGKGGEIRVAGRDYMTEGSTLPIRVTYTLNKNGRTTVPVVYVKKMNLNRVLLQSLYELATGRTPSVKFSECTVVEPEIKGRSLQQSYKADHKLLGDPKMRRELIRLGVVSNFLSLYDMDNGSNIIVDSNGKFRVIDFDKGFWEPISLPTEGLLNPFVVEINKGTGKEIMPLPDEKLAKKFAPGEVEAVTRDEMGRISENLSRNEERFHEIVDLMASIPFYNLGAKELYGEKDVASYFAKKQFEFKGKSR